jgi:hypothetical protein
MPFENMLYKSECRINDRISVRIPTVSEVLEREPEYYGLVSLITSTPYDMMVQLDDIGIDFTKINDYDMFVLLFNSVRSHDTAILFGDLDLSGFAPSVNPQNNMVILRDEKSGAVIDRGIHDLICKALRSMNSLERNHKTYGNEDGRQYMIQRAREKLKRRMQRAKTESSNLEELIVALVNTEQFSYGFEDVLRMSIYQFNASLHQVIHKIDYDNKMRGVYAGTISAKEMKPEELNWLKNKQGGN